ncbi:hypothetical protein DMT42_13100 [Streptomyces actuosus]|uniref:Uncharacterized protein n=1 Tax=Streptomyces actuosus TaxID=1885 RepID=A0A2U9P0Q8_STRAS|nr:hypothetical protein DMT42_13100 [Streptomyces actuosus]
MRRWVRSNSCRFFPAPAAGGHPPTRPLLAVRVYRPPWLRQAAPLGRRPPSSGEPSHLAAGSRAAGAARVGAAAPP